MKCIYVINLQKYEELKSYLLSFKRDEEDWDKWICNFTEIVSQLTNYKIKDKIIITFQLFCESILLGYKTDIVAKEYLNVSDYGRLLIGLMSKIKSFDSLTIEEKKYFAWCIILTCCCYEKIEDGLSCFYSVDNVVREYNEWEFMYFETLNNLPKYDLTKPLGTIENPLVFVSLQDAENYLRNLIPESRDRYYWHLCDVRKIKFLDSCNLFLYKIFIPWSSRFSCCRNWTEENIFYIDVFGIANCVALPDKFIFKSTDNIINLSKILLGFSIFCSQCVSSEVTWNEFGLNRPSEFGIIQSWFASKKEKIKRAFLEKELYALVAGIMVRSFVDIFWDYLYRAEDFVHLIIGYQFHEQRKSDNDAYFYDVLSLAKDYLYLNCIDKDIFIAHATLYDINIVNDKKIIGVVQKLINYCYEESESFIKEHYNYKIIDDLSKLK